VTLDENSLPLKTQIGTFENESDIQEWILDQKSSKVLAIDYITFIRYAPLIYTEEIGEYLMRYKLLKEYRLYSYGNLVDDLPARFVDVLGIIDSEVPKAMESKNGK
jgi:hypothetical protein